MHWIWLVILIILEISGWGSLYLFKGRPKIIAWWFIQILGIVGVITIITCIILIMKDIIKHKKTKLIKVITCLMAIFVAWPAGWIFKVAQIAYPADVHAVKPSVTVSVPFQETTIVGWGGDKLEHNYHVTVPVQRYAYDLLIEPAGMGSHKLEDYGIYGKDIIAPASGVIIDLQGNEEDMTPGILDEADTRLGNYIYIKLDETGTYLVLAHLMKDSILVEKGQHIDEGTVIAKAGNSGDSSEPHLHIHHQRENPLTHNFLLSEGLPLYFKSDNGPIMPNGGVRVEDGCDVPIGDKISPVQITK